MTVKDNLVPLEVFPLLAPSAVVATMRDLKRKDKLVEAAGEAYGKTLSLAVLDVCSDESVKQCINGIKDRHVDVLSESPGTLRPVRRHRRRR